MKRIAWVATMMLLCIVNVCAEQSAVPSSASSDWQRNEPIVSQSSYPTTTADLGVSMKFSLTR